MCIRDSDGTVTLLLDGPCVLGRLPPLEDALSLGRARGLRILSLIHI